MLITFRVSNYTSFDDTLELSMIAGRSGSNPAQTVQFDGFRLVRASAIYGANASGKSNVVKALRSMWGLVVHNRPIPPDRYFRPESEKAEVPSTFETEVEIDGKVYSYGFSCLISKQEVTEEWLYRLFPDAESEVVFTRIGKKIEHPFDGSDKQKLDVYAEDAVEHSERLFMNVMGRRARSQDSGLSVFNDVYDWFSNKLVFVDTNFPFSPEVPVSDDDLEKLNEIMSTFGTGVNGIAYERKPGLEELLPRNLIEQMRNDLKSGSESMKLDLREDRYTSVKGYRASLENDKIVLDEIVYRHNGDSISYRPEEESDGTRKLYGLLTSIFLRKDGSTYVIDELDSSLHPQLTYRFIKLFLDDERKSRSQIVFTTHESSLLDFDLLRRDEVWFVQKDRCGRSRLYSLEEFNERSDRRIEKAYREGRYGGVPIFSALYPPWGEE